MKIAFLHTSKSHINLFSEIVKKVNPAIKMTHYVNEELLEFSKKTGEANQQGFRDEVDKIRGIENGFIICTCSTYGAFCEDKKNIFRIDQPIAEYIISNFSNIGIAYTLDSTKEISKKLLEEIADETSNSIHITEIDCSDFWRWFEQGDIEKYEVGIANRIKQKSANFEVVFLAQASMEGAKKYFLDEKYKVVSSPEFGVKKYLEMMFNIEASLKT